MLWPLVLPFQISAACLASLVVVLTAAAPRWRWKRGSTFLIATMLALFALVPSCTVVQLGIDALRFGRFDYADVSQIDDFRARRYLPDAAVDIEMHKHAQGYRARYSISEADFQSYLDGLWETYGSRSAVERGGYAGEESAADATTMQLAFGDLGWPTLESAVEFHSPTEPDGGGAVYYFDRQTGIAYQRTGYW
ncbi:hypothetical protein Pla123a_48270 [Posidoniimonas polymericola]|uniref:Uncharacterized protein n=1 Tax=Posidoniimonas polymericola TaxID=2528002 RepID=A0A5C5XRP7_9BACT|nr:hypothetical protein [Posidoniimonas polymericola]TWT65916.1 hypothetical protein Pla123a_48270 [Posidoniimonas polymericola]